MFIIGCYKLALMRGLSAWFLRLYPNVEYRAKQLL